MAARARIIRNAFALAALFLMCLSPLAAFASNADAIPFLKNVQSCNPSLGSDCSQTPRSDPQCVVDADCTMGCTKNLPVDDQTPGCHPVDNTNTQCLAALGNPLQKGVACGCLDTHKCGYLAKPDK